MTDHRRVQRTLFRMQLDSDFAAALFAGDAAATASTDLAADDLALLTSLDPARVSADRDDARARQLLGNLATEMPLTVGRLTARGGEAALRAFLASPAFHRAVRTDAPLPLAFAAWARDAARGPAERALAALEEELVRARRALRDGPAPRAGQVALAPWCRLLRAPDGTHTRAMALTADPGGPDAGAGAAPLDGDAQETLLVQADPDPGPDGRRGVRVERLEPAVAALLERCREPAAPGELADWAADLGAAPAELLAFVEALLDDGVLVRAP